MSVLSALTDNKIHTFEQAFNVKDITSHDMQNAIRSWFAMYFDGGNPPEEDDCQRLPVMIVNKLNKTIFSEYETSVDGEGDKAVFMQTVLDQLNDVHKEAAQQMLVGGTCLIKPVLTQDGFIFSVVRRDCFIPLSRSIDGRLTSVGTAESTTVDGKYYTLLERRTVSQGKLTIESRLYISDTRSTIGTQVPLSTLPQYTDLQPSFELPIDSIGMVALQTPMLNCVDGSKDGISVYAPAVSLIRNINRNERLLDDEFERGQSRIIASADFLNRDENGRKRLEANVFTAIDDDPELVGITIFSPALREASYLARKQEYLRNIESLIGFKRGILSEVEAAERTATEITSSAGDYNLTIQDFQQAWADAVRETLVLCDTLGQIYHLCDSAKFDPESVVIDWGDGVLFNRDKVWAEYSSMVAAGLLKPELALAWYFSLPHETPDDIAKIRADYMPEMEQLVNGGDE